MGTVTVSGNTYSIYNTDLPAVKLYLAAAVGAGPDAWNASVDDNAKGKAVVAAKRYLDGIRYQGLKTGGQSQVDQWPRSGVVDADNLAIDSATVPTGIKSAEAELAAIFMTDPTVNAALHTGSNVRQVMAKGVSVAFFRPTDTPSQSTKLPVVLMRLIGQYLASAVGNSSASTYYQSNDDDDDSGCDIDSSFSDDAILDRVGPFG